MAEAAKVEYHQKASGATFTTGDFVKIEVNHTDKTSGKEIKRYVHGIIAGAGTDQSNNEVKGTWNLEIPGWDSLHGPQKDGKPTGGHIYSVRPLACAVPEKDFSHAGIPKVMNVCTTGPKKSRINGDYKLGEAVDKRPAWYFTCADDVELILCFKKQKGKPAWLITRKENIVKNKDGGYALFAQDLWLPSHREHHLRGEVWGTWDTEGGKWVADQSLWVTEGPGEKSR